MNILFKTILNIAGAWAMVVLYSWYQHGGPDGAYNLMIGYMWVLLIGSPIGLVVFGERFMEDHREAVITAVAKQDCIPEKLRPYLFDTPDLLLFAYAAWVGDAWIAAGALIVMFLGQGIRSLRDARRKDLGIVV